EVSYHGKNGQSRSTGAPGSAAAELVRSMPVQFICSFGRRPMMTSIERQTMKKVYLRILPFCSLFHLLSGPREYRVRGADDEQGSRVELVHFRARRRRVLLGLLYLGGAEQFDPRPG